MTIRWLIATVSTIVLAIQIVRTAAVAEYAELEPRTAAVFWAGHPAVEIARGMLEIAAASRQHQSVKRASLELIDDAARKAPLSPQPFLVHGVAALVAGKRAAASRDFLEAQRRDPRSLAAAYFLAEYYFRTDQPVQGLLQTGILARLSPEDVGIVASYIAAYAQSPSEWPQIRKLFATDATIEDSVLVALSRDARNAPAVLAIADPQHRQARSPWLPTLLHSLINAGDYARSHAIWVAVAKPAGSAKLIYDPTFSEPDAPPPFNWALTSSRLGIAERMARHGLHVIYYGQDSDVLASQLLLLTPGTYHWEAPIDSGGVRASSLNWTIRCAGSKTPMSSVSAAAAASKGWDFEIPKSCAAQWLELAGIPSDIAEQSEVTIVRVNLTQVNTGA